MKAGGPRAVTRFDQGAVVLEFASSPLQSRNYLMCDRGCSSDYEEYLLRVLTDRGSEYCGNPERQEYELYLAIEDIDHSRTKTKSPQTNGICERFHKTRAQRLLPRGVPQKGVSFNR